MIIDQNLHFLQYCSNGDLKSFCDTLTHDRTTKCVLMNSLPTARHISAAILKTCMACGKK